MEGLKIYPSYQESVGIDGEAIEFDWNIFPGFSSLAILHEIQKDLDRKNIKPEEFKDQIGRGSGMENLLTLHKENGTPQPTKWYTDSKKPITLCSKVPVP